MSILHVVSVSGGKDSAATLLIALKRFGPAKVIPIFCDTGNEHPAVHEYLAYLEQALDIQIVRLRANFDAEIAAKRRFIANDRRTKRQYETEPVFDADGNPVPKRDGRGRIVMHKVKRDGVEVEEPIQKTKKVGGGRRVRWTNKAKRRALAILHPTGNPFLNLCLWKGRFPSRKAQFCTEELKRNIAVRFQLDLIDQGNTVVSWQGIRREESTNRANAKKFEPVGGGLYIYRPIVDWSAKEVFDYCQSYGVQPNPLYKQGMKRVGCMPCINCGKEEIRQIADRFPEFLAEKERWEQLVGQASKRGFSTFFNKERHDGVTDRRLIYEAECVESIISWARTSRGGKQFDMFMQAEVFEPLVCESAYGLCAGA